MDERFNGSLVKILRNYVNEYQTDWDVKLKWALSLHNTTTNESTKFSPYSILFGRQPRGPFANNNGTKDSFLPPHEAIHEVVRSNNRAAQQVQKYYYD